MTGTHFGTCTGRAARCRLIGTRCPFGDGNVGHKVQTWPGIDRLKLAAKCRENARWPDLTPLNPLIKALWTTFIPAHKQGLA